MPIHAHLLNFVLTFRRPKGLAKCEADTTMIWMINWTYRGALLPGVEDVVFPDGDAVCGEPDPLEAVSHQLVGDDPQRPALPGRLRQVLPHVHAEILEQKISESS